MIIIMNQRWQATPAVNVTITGTASNERVPHPARMHYLRKGCQAWFEIS